MLKRTAARLRPFERDDAVRMLAWVNDADTAPLLGRCLPVTRLQHDEWYERNINDERHAFFAIETCERQEHVGVVWLYNIHPQHRNAELRILIGDATHQGQGIGGEAVDMLLEFAFQRLGLHKVYLYVIASNERAVRAFERSGFEREGVLVDEFFVDGVYVDVLRMGVRRDRMNPAPASPQAAATLG